MLRSGALGGQVVTVKVLQRQVRKFRSWPLRKLRSQKHPKGARKSDRAIAEHCGVDGKTVARWREKLSAEIPQIEEREVTRNGTTYTQDTTNIGSTAEAEEVEESPNSPFPSTYSPIPRVLSESVYVDASGAVCLTLSGAVGKIRGSNRFWT